MSVSLFVKQATVAPAVKVAHIRVLQHTDAKYVIDRLIFENILYLHGNKSLSSIE